jgi:predicted protein tyrosine phosphatase
MLQVSTKRVGNHYNTCFEVSSGRKYDGRTPLTLALHEHSSWADIAAELEEAHRYALERAHIEIQARCRGERPVHA